MICHILGLGPSIKDYQPDQGFSIGCNDSFKHHYSDWLVVVSNLIDLERDRIVMNSRPKKLLSFLPHWSQHPDYEYIGQLHPWRDDRKNRLDKGMVYTSNNTPFIQCSLAFNAGYREIVLWGVDLTNHKLLKGPALDKTKSDFKQLEQAFIQEGANLFLGSPGSVLDLPLWK